MSALGMLLRVICCLCLLGGFSTRAAEPLDRPQIEAQKLLLQKERDDIATVFAVAARQCWQRFLVNDCLHAARLQRRQALSPIEKQDQALRAAQRSLAVIERQERLDAKQPESKEPHDARP
jgi:hypothetical protein